MAGKGSRKKSRARDVVLRPTELEVRRLTLTGLLGRHSIDLGFEGSFPNRRNHNADGWKARASRLRIIYGRNGSGKSTALRVIRAALQGDVKTLLASEFSEAEIAARTVPTKAQRKLGSTPQMHRLVVMRTKDPLQIRAEWWCAGRKVREWTASQRAQAKLRRAPELKAFRKLRLAVVSPGRKGAGSSPVGKPMLTGLGELQDAIAAHEALTSVVEPILNADATKLATKLGVAVLPAALPRWRNTSPGWESAERKKRLNWTKREWIEAAARSASPLAMMFEGKESFPEIFGNLPTPEEVRAQQENIWRESFGDQFLNVRSERGFEADRVARVARRLANLNRVPAWKDTDFSFKAQVTKVSWPNTWGTSKAGEKYLIINSGQAFLLWGKDSSLSLVSTQNSSDRRRLTGREQRQMQRSVRKMVEAWNVRLGKPARVLKDGARDVPWTKGPLAIRPDAEVLHSLPPGPLLDNEIKRLDQILYWALVLGEEQILNQTLGLAKDLQRHHKLASAFSLTKKTVEKYLEGKTLSSSGQIIASDGTLIPTEGLSDGELQILGLCTELIARPALSNHAPDLVILDEPELHLHIRWQEAVIPLVLSKMGRRTAVLVATHSPAVIGDFMDRAIPMGGPIL